MEAPEHEVIPIVDSDSEKDVVEAIMQRHLEERRKEIYTTTSRVRSCRYIDKVPENLKGMYPKASEPEIVSIGPYHRGNDKLLQCEDYKWYYLDSLVNRSVRKEVGLPKYVDAMKKLEMDTRNCYRESIPMSSTDFVQMMVLDGCFVIEVLRRICPSEDAVIHRNDPFLSKPWLITILFRDLLKLENQLPFFVLQNLFELSKVVSRVDGDPLPLLALKFFHIAFPRPHGVLKKLDKIVSAQHLLDLFHQSFVSLTEQRPCRYYPTSDQSIQCLTQLRSSGIKFQSEKADSFLAIDFQKGILRNGILKIPPITINEFAVTAFLNCIAFEQSNRPFEFTHFTAYVAFMSRLIISARDVAFLCGDNIMTNFYQNDQYIVDVFQKLGENVVFDVKQCYLSKQFEEVEAYYGSHYAFLMRKYFGNPWLPIKILLAFILLTFAGLQTMFGMLSYINPQH